VLFLLAAIVVLLLARLPSIPVRFFDPDELEHARAAFSVWKGLLPYRDFFEHHTPWYHFLLASFFRWFSAEQSFDGAMHFLEFARTLSLVLTGAATVVMFFVGRVRAHRTVGLLAALFFVGQPVIIQKTVEIRPDVPALLFFLGGLWFVVRGLDDEPAARPHLRLFAGGACVGAAIMCTQKMVFVLPGAALGLALWVLDGGKARFGRRAGAVLLLGAGVALPVLVTWALFALQGAGRQFVFDNFLLNAKWKARVNRHLFTTMETSAPILALGLLGAVRAVRTFRRDRSRAYGDVFLLCTLAGLIAGIWIVPIAYRQYFLMPLAILCLLAAKGLDFLVALAKEGRRVWVLVLATLPLLILPGFELASSAVDHDAQQSARLRYVFEHTRPGDRVLDGWLGTAVFRPSSVPYLFMHSELLAMLTEQEKATYLDAVEDAQTRPAMIVLDDDLKALGPRFLRFVQQHYATDDGLFYRLAPPAAP